MSEAPQTLTGIQKRKARFVVVLWVGFVVALWAMPSSPVSGMILCPFRFLTGWSCPGCGMTRSCTAAVHGDLWTSLSFHPLGALFVLGFTLTAIHRAVELVRDRPVDLGARYKYVSRLVSVGVLIFVLAFGALRLGLEIAGVIPPV